MTHTIDSLIDALREHRKITPGDTPVSLGWNGWSARVTSIEVVDMPSKPSVENIVPLCKELVLS